MEYDLAASFDSFVFINFLFRLSSAVLVLQLSVVYLCDMIPVPCIFLLLSILSNKDCHLLINRMANICYSDFCILMLFLFVWILLIWIFDVYKILDIIPNSWRKYLFVLNMITLPVSGDVGLVFHFSVCLPDIWQSCSNKIVTCASSFFCSLNFVKINFL